MMLEYTSGKVGYKLRRPNKTSVDTEEYFEADNYRASWLIHDVTVPQLVQKLNGEQISFFTLKRNPDFVAEHHSHKEAFVLESVGEKGTSLDGVLPHDRCLVVFSREKKFVWTPDDAAKEERELYSKFGQKWINESFSRK